MELRVYHGSNVAVEFPEIRTARYHKDFYFGFYCTRYPEQAKRWATRHTGVGVVSEYIYHPDASLRVLAFEEMSEAWLDFIAACRMGKPHDYDVVEGPMADDMIFNYVQQFMDGEISREAFWALARFKRPTHQISFHTARALSTLQFVRAEEVTDDD